MADLIGQAIGNYRLVRLLGRGGFADVYLGEHRYLKNYAALKILRISLTDKDASRFLSEAQILRRLTHPNIVRVLDFSVERGTPVLIMDYAPGGTARQRHPVGSSLSLSKTVDSIKQVAAALQYAHNYNLIHRDVKPENILFDQRQQLLLSDFGLALFTPSPELLSTQEMAGTIPYTAPEQLRGRPTFASDQYALGVITYEWLCGRRPFIGTQWEIIQQHLSTLPPPLRETHPELPEAVEAVVLRALAKNPQERFVSVQAFALALERSSRESQVDSDEGIEITASLQPVWHPKAVVPPSRTPSDADSYLPQGVFMAGSPSDEAFATRLKTDLEARGIIVWNERLKDTVEVVTRENAQRQEIRAAQVVLVVVSPYTRTSRTVKEQIRIADMYRHELVFVWAAGEEKAEVLPDLGGRITEIDLLDARGTRYEHALDEIAGYFKEETATTAPMEPDFTEIEGEPRNPYKGLRAFTQQDTADFFGREALIQDLVETTKSMVSASHPGAPGARLLTVLGASGSGKSSLVMAGLLPQLKRGALPSSEQWIYLEPMVPGTHPLESLAQTLVRHLPRWSVQDIHTELQNDAARGLHMLAIQVEKHPGANVVLVLDQFEELFTQTISEQERQHLIDLLMTGVMAPRGPLVVILTLRADFYDRPLAYPELGRLIEHRHCIVLPMDIEDLRAVIEQPAALPDVRLTFEGQLVGDLLFEAQGQVGALPLLEFTLDQLFQQRDGHWLTLQAYRKIGGVKGALAIHAESTYQALPSEEHRRLARALFLRLIEPGFGEHDSTRRRATFSELALPDPKQSTIIREVADTFVNARLLTTNETAGTTTIEVSHEALIREWARLAGWLLETREDLALQKAIHADAAEWVRREKPMDRLYRGSQLTEAQAWVGRNVPSADEVAFLQASAAERQQQEEIELSRQARELQLQRRALSRQRLLISVLSIFSVIVILLASFAGINYLQAVTQRKLAEQEAQIALTQALLASSRLLALNASNALAQNELDLSLLLSAQAEKTYDTFEARNSLFNALEQSPHILTILRGGSSPVGTLAFSHDGKMLLSSDGFTVFLWDTTTRNGHLVQLKGNSFMVGSATVSPNNRTLLTSAANGVFLWDIQTGTPTQLAPAIPDLSITLGTTVAFSADGTLVASGRCSQHALSQGLPSCLETSISVWNVQSTKSVGSTIVVPADVKSIAFSPDGKSLVSASHAGIQFWNAATGQALGSALANSTTATSLAFSPDGKILASGNADNSVRLWDVATEASHGAPFMRHTGPVLSVAFSPDGKTLASASEDKTVILWNVATGQAITTFANDDAQPKTSVTFSPDGKTLASGNQDGTITLWNIDADSTINHRLADIGGLESALFTPDGQMVLTGNENGKVLLQDAQTGKLIDTLDMSSYPLLAPQNAAGNDLSAIQSLALSGTTLAAGRLDGTIIVWNLQTRKVLALLKHPALLHKISLSADGHMLASGGDGATIMLWDVAKQAPIRSLHVDYRLPALSVALSPDSTLLAAGNCGQKSANGSCQQVQVLLWNAHTGKLIDHIAAGSVFDILDVAFSLDGHTLAASSNAGIRLWDVTTRKPIGSTLAIPGGNTAISYYSNILFSPDGTKLASYSEAGTLFYFALWDVTQDQLFAHALNEDGSFQGSVAFTPNGQQLVTVFDRSGEGIFLLWDITTASWEDQACSIANRNLTKDEWNQFVTDGNRSKVCPGLPLD